MALLDVLSEELVFNRSNEHELQKPLVLRNTSQNNLVAFRLSVNTPEGLFVLDPPMGIIELNNTKVVNIIMNPTIPNEEGKFYKICIEALDVSNANIDLENLWRNMVMKDDPWVKEIEIVLDPELVDDRQDGANNYNLNEVMDLTDQFSKLKLKVEKERNKKLDFTAVLTTLIVIVGMVLVLVKFSP